MNTAWKFTALGIGLALLLALFWLWQQTFTHYNAVPLWLGVLALLALVLGIQRVSRVVWLWWGLGLLTLIWSHTPGNTLMLGVWELIYLGSFAAGAMLHSRWQVGFWVLCLGLLGYGLYSAVSVNLFFAPMFFSGSLHYVTGAQALLLIPPLFAYINRDPKWGLFASIALTAATYAALMSGARSVYLPLLLLLIVLLGRLWLEKRQPLKLLGFTAVIIIAVSAIDWAIPVHPIQSALLPKTSVAKQASDVGAEGSFGSRLQMWEQTVGIAITEPLGTGNGSFRDVIAAYQRYAGVNFSNAHNYYLETLATGGWLRFLVLLGMVGWVLWMGWRSSAWPWALGVAGLWATLAFDITGMYPGVMALAFAGLGFVYGQSKPLLVAVSPSSKRLNLLIPGLGLSLAVGLMAWWYWPCNDCAVGRHMGFRPDVLNAVTQLPEAERTVLLEQAARLNPKSVWVKRIQLQYAQTDQAKLEILQSITSNFPLAGPSFYLEQAKVAQRLGLTSDALESLRSGLTHFPLDFVPAAVPLGGTEPYQNWKQEVPGLLKALEAQ